MELSLEKDYKSSNRHMNHNRIFADHEKDQ